MTFAQLGNTIVGLYNYWIIIVLMMVGLYIVITHDNLVKKIIGLNLFQTSVIIFYISMGVITGSTAPIITEGDPVYAHPLPAVLMLTAIVVGISTVALALALVVRIHEAYDSVEEDEILLKDKDEQPAQRPAEEADRT